MSILSTKDEGKWVTDQFGRELGIVTEVDAERQVAHVESAPNLTETMIQGLGFGDADADDFEVPADWVVTVTDSELRVENEP
jgi:sporulation protein YlmC with PRC-barrel domain